MVSGYSRSKTSLRVVVLPDILNFFSLDVVSFMHQVLLGVRLFRDVVAREESWEYL